MHDAKGPIVRRNRRVSIIDDARPVALLLVLVVAAVGFRSERFELELRGRLVPFLSTVLHSP